MVSNWWCRKGKILVFGAKAKDYKGYNGDCEYRRITPEIHHYGDCEYRITPEIVKYCEIVNSELSFKLLRPFIRFATL